MPIHRPVPPIAVEVFDVLDLNTGDHYKPTFECYTLENGSNIWLMMGFTSCTDTKYFPPRGDLWEYESYPNLVFGFISNIHDDGTVHSFKVTKCA